AAARADARLDRRLGLEGIRREDPLGPLPTLWHPGGLGPVGVPPLQSGRPAHPKPIPVPRHGDAGRPGRRGHAGAAPAAERALTAPAGHRPAPTPYGRWARRTE